MFPIEDHQHCSVEGDVSNLQVTTDDLLTRVHDLEEENEERDVTIRRLNEAIQGLQARVEQLVDLVAGNLHD
jgi:uncharacterized protein YoxC